MAGWGCGGAAVHRLSVELHRPLTVVGPGFSLMWRLVARLLVTAVVRRRRGGLRRSRRGAGARCLSVDLPQPHHDVSPGLTASVACSLGTWGGGVTRRLLVPARIQRRGCGGALRGLQDRGRGSGRAEARGGLSSGLHRLLGDVGAGRSAIASLRRRSRGGRRLPWRSSRGVRLGSGGARRAEACCSVTGRRPLLTRVDPGRLPFTTRWPRRKPGRFAAHDRVGN